MRHWPPGQQIHNGKYIIEAILGGGGFGVTYRAQQPKEGKVVAIKTLNANVQGKPNFREYQTKFVNEALSLARCSHPHVVQVYEVFPEMAGNIELWCMVMELIDGTNLAEYLEDNGILSEAKALPIIQQVGSALSFVHQKKFTHLDIKPQNVMLRKRGFEAVLIDFGLARQVTAPGKLRTNSNSGTECYAPIELLEKRAELGAYTDVYSLAATLYVMLTGELPFPSQFRKQNIPLTPPKQHNSEISDRVNVAIMKGMELEPQNRPQSVQEWLDLLIPKPVAAETTRVVSAVGMDYTNLQNLLASKKWREADEETARVMLKVAGREKEGGLNTESIDNFPGEDLRTIDQLWVKYSNGRFGFSVQKRIYKSLGGTREYDSEVWEKFGDRVGWRKNNKWLYYKDLTFSEKAPEAHLPLRSGWVGWRLGVGWVVLFSRVNTESIVLKQMAVEVKLVSTVGMDYTNLQNLLATGKWKEADEETARVMLKVAGREEKGWLNIKDIEKFPCHDLRTIDQLWVQYSNGHFGFSVQKCIYQSLGGTTQYDTEVWYKFGDKVGWRKKDQWLYYNDLTFSEKLPEAHLPMGCFLKGVGKLEKLFGWGLVSSFSSRLVKCNI
ncbi:MULTISPECIES: serine/threonine-protein kinase [unclassified Microcoleus]|uniref:serine/threonine-protein kinase n=1 Tax=unclassified Microcoleus TaxID=2642155 RepID=UPI0025E9ADC5|nr:MULTISPECIES: serine/threonine-protein kinase [unclassified Microcoleus]